jgi:hypothetical protein
MIKILIILKLLNYNFEYLHHTFFHNAKLQIFNLLN